MLKAPVQRAVECYHCHAGFEAAERALTLTCPKCYKPLRLDDIAVRTVTQARVMETCGRIVVERKGWLMAASVYAGRGLQVFGALEARATVSPEVLIAATARWRGNLRAHRVIVEGGGRVEGGYFEIDPRGGVLAPAVVDRLASVLSLNNPPAAVGAR